MGDEKREFPKWPEEGDAKSGCSSEGEKKFGICHINYILALCNTHMRTRVQKKKSSIFFLFYGKGPGPMHFFFGEIRKNTLAAGGEGC